MRGERPADRPLEVRQDKPQNTAGSTCCRSICSSFVLLLSVGNAVPSTPGQAACKPGSVPTTRSGDGGWPFLWGGRCRTPRATYPDDWPGNRPSRRSGSVVPTWSCSRWGLPCRRRCRRRGALLPHPFTLARRPKAPAGRLLSVALSLGSPPPGITRHRVSVEPGLSSPELPRGRPSGHLAQPRCRLARLPFQALTTARARRPAARASPGPAGRRPARDENDAGRP
jgi:hypothetical protein